MLHLNFRSFFCSFNEFDLIVVDFWPHNQNK